MKPTHNIVRSTLVALPLAIFGGMATAGGLAEPVATPVPVAPPPVVPVGTDWTGFYAGGQLGFGQLDAELADDDALTDNESGALYGVHAGYLYDFGDVVLGGEVDYDLTNIEPDTALDESFEVDSIARAKVLLGYDAGQFLPYVTGGAVQAAISSDADALDGDGDGTFAGIGAKYLLSDSIMLGGEVLQHQFEDFVTDGLDVDATTATVRASFRF